MKVWIHLGRRSLISDFSDMTTEGQRRQMAGPDNCCVAELTVEELRSGNGYGGQWWVKTWKPVTVDVLTGYRLYQTSVEYTDIEGEIERHNTTTHHRADGRQVVTLNNGDDFAESENWWSPNDYYYQVYGRWSWNITLHIYLSSLTYLPLRSWRQATGLVRSDDVSGLILRDE